MPIGWLLGSLAGAPTVVLSAQEAPTLDSLAMLGRELELVRHATARLQQPEAARRAGYRSSPLRAHPLLGERWTLRRTLRSGRRLDVRRPSWLFYARVDGRPVLAGVGYEALLHSTDSVPQGFVGAQDRWRIEERFGPQRGLPLNPAMRAAIARERGKHRHRVPDQVALLHAWLWLPNPDGVFARYNRVLPYLRAGLPADYASFGDWDSAQGTALLEEGVCEAELKALRWMLRGATADQMRAFPAACSRAVAEIRNTRRSAASAATFNAGAARAWRAYNHTLFEMLSSEQQVRVEVLLGPGGLLNPRLESEPAVGKQLWHASGPC